MKVGQETENGRSSWWTTIPTTTFRQVVLDFQKESDFATRYVLEPVQGLSYARNRGVAEARGEIIDSWTTISRFAPVG
jgi:hypothetical protein